MYPCPLPSRGPHDHTRTTTRPPPPHPHPHPPPLPPRTPRRSALGDGRREFVEVNDAVAISVHAAHDALTLNEGHLLARSELEREAELGRIEEAVT